MLKIAGPSVVLGYVFILGPLIDLLTGMVNLGYLEFYRLGLSPSQIYRGLSFLIVLYVRRPVYWAMILATLFIFAVPACLRFYTGRSDLEELLYATKPLYFVVLCLGLASFIEERNASSITVRNCLLVGLFILSVNVWLSFVFGLGESTYLKGNAVKGYYSSGNALGVYLGFGLLIYTALSSKSRGLIEIISGTVIGGALVLVGTKAALILIFVNCFYLFSRIHENRKRAGRSQRAPVLALILLMLVAMAVVLPIAFDEVYRRYQINDFLTFIFSGRVQMVVAAIAQLSLESLSANELLFGGGVSTYAGQLESVDRKLLESDPFDLAFRFGLVGLAWVVFFLCYCLRFVEMRSVSMLVVLLLIGHSIAAGHVLFNGAVASLLALAFAMALGRRAAVGKGPE